jgi:hypothetical protein
MTASLAMQRLQGKGRVLEQLLKRSDVTVKDGEHEIGFHRPLSRQETYNMQGRQSSKARKKTGGKG